MELLVQRLCTFLRLFPQENFANKTIYFISTEYDKSEVTDDPNSQNFAALKCARQSDLAALLLLGHNVID